MEMEFNGEYAGSYNVNFAEVIKHTECLAVTRMLARDIMDNPYMVVGDWFKNLPMSDLTTLSNLAGAEPEEANFEDLILISMMLATAEGVQVPDTQEGIRKLVAQFTAFLIIESLARKGLVRVYHENMSFGDELGDKIVVEKI